MGSIRLQQQRKVEMSRFARVVSLFAVPVLFAACSPGSTDTPLSPAGPRHDTGTPVLGGNVTPPADSTATTTSTTSSSGGELDDPDAATGTPVIGGN